MKIKSIIIGLLVLCCHNIMAQDLKMGFHVGGNLSGYTGGKQYTIYDKSGKVGYEVGAVLAKKEHKLYSHLPATLCFYGF